MKRELSRRDFLKRSGAATIGSASLLALAGCSSDDSDEESVSETAEDSAEESENAAEALITASEDIEVADGVEEVITSSYVRPSLVVGGTDPGSIPVYDPQVDGCVVLWEMYENLFEQASFGADMTPVLCDKSKGEHGGYDHEAGTGIYTFYIYDYISDSKGYELTASDVVFDFETYISKGATISGLVGVTATDDYTVELEFDEELDGLGELDAYMSSVFIYTQKAYEESGDDFTMSAVGTGRYELVDFVAGSGITLKKRDNYWQTDESLIPQNQQANVEELRVDFISETAQKVIALETGTVDMVESLDTQYVDEFLEDERYRVYSYKNNLTQYVIFNCSEYSICHDVNIRQAIALAIDIDGLMTALGDSFAARAYTLGNDNFSDYNYDWETWDNYNTKSGAGDAEEIQALLDAAGYDGEDIVFLGGTGSTTEKVLTVIQAQLLTYGINIKLSQLSSSAQTVAREDPTQWDLLTSSQASKGYIASMWGDKILHASASSNGHTVGWIEDDTFEELIDTVTTVDGHTAENIDACWQHIVDNVYIMGLFSEYYNAILPANLTTLVCNNRQAIIHTACVFTDPDA